MMKWATPVHAALLLKVILLSSTSAADAIRKATLTPYGDKATLTPQGDVIKHQLNESDNNGTSLIKKSSRGKKEVEEALMALGFEPPEHGPQATFCGKGYTYEQALQAKALQQQVDTDNAWIEVDVGKEPEVKIWCCRSDGTTTEADLTGETGALTGLGCKECSDEQWGLEVGIQVNDGEFEFWCCPE